MDECAICQQPDAGGIYITAPYPGVAETTTYMICSDCVGLIREAAPGIRIAANDPCLYCGRAEYASHTDNCAAPCGACGRRYRRNGVVHLCPGPPTMKLKNILYYIDGARSPAASLSEASLLMTDAISLACAGDGFPGSQWRDMSTGRWYESLFNVETVPVTDPARIAELEALWQENEEEDNCD